MLFNRIRITSTTKEDKKKLLSEESLRHNEYYGMQGVFDALYAQSRSGEVFEDLTPKILSRENILLAYQSEHRK